jgi:hypothetical protein
MNKHDGDEMNSDHKDTKDTKQNELRKINLLTTPGAMALGLGAYAKFAVHGNAFHPLLNDQSVVNGLLIFGAASIIWGGIQVSRINQRRKNGEGQDGI